MLRDPLTEGLQRPVAERKVRVARWLAPVLHRADEAVDALEDELRGEAEGVRLERVRREPVREADRRPAFVNGQLAREQVSDERHDAGVAKVQEMARVVERELAHRS